MDMEITKQLQRIMEMANSDDDNNNQNNNNSSSGGSGRTNSVDQNDTEQIKLDIVTKKSSNNNNINSDNSNHRIEIIQEQSNHQQQYIQCIQPSFLDLYGLNRDESDLSQYTMIQIEPLGSDQLVFPLPPDHQHQNQQNTQPQQTKDNNDIKNQELTNRVLNYGHKQQHNHHPHHNNNNTDNDDHHTKNQDLDTPSSYHTTMSIPIEEILHDKKLKESSRMQDHMDTNFEQEFIRQLEKIDQFFAERSKKFKVRLVEFCNMIPLLKENPHLRNQRNINYVRDGFQDCYRYLALLISFRNINKEGFNKLLSKYQKYNPTICQVCKELLDKKSFYHNEDLDHLVSQMKYIYARYFTGNDTKLAKYELKKPLLGENRTLIFTVGLLFGLCVVLGIICIYSYSMNYPSSNPPHDSPLAWLLFRVSLLPILLGSLFSLQSFVWERSSINYVLIFNLKPEYSRSSLRYLKFGLIFIGFWLLCLFLYIDTTSNNI